MYLSTALGLSSSHWTFSIPSNQSWHLRSKERWEILLHGQVLTWRLPDEYLGLEGGEWRLVHILLFCSFFWQNTICWKMTETYDLWLKDDLNLWLKVYELVRVGGGVSRLSSSAMISLWTSHRYLLEVQECRIELEWFFVLRNTHLRTFRRIIFLWFFINAFY